MTIVIKLDRLPEFGHRSDAKKTLKTTTNVEKNYVTR
jgi:hypothetical protein